MDIGCTIAPERYGRYFPNIGAPDFCRVFYRPDAGLRPLEAAAVADLPKGTVPWISHKDRVPLEAVAKHWRGLLLKITRSDQKIRWTYFHESAGDGAPDRREYLAYWRDLADMASAFPYVELVQVQTLYAMRWRVDTDWRDWMIPGITVGFDCYPLAEHRYEPPESIFGFVRAAGEYVGAKWGVPELGADARIGQDRGRWLTECVEYLGERGADFVGLWGSGKAYEPSDPATLAAFRGIVAL